MLIGLLAVRPRGNIGRSNADFVILCRAASHRGIEDTIIPKRIPPLLADRGQLIDAFSGLHTLGSDECVALDEVGERKMSDDFGSVQKLIHFKVAEMPNEAVALLLDCVTGPEGLA